jgi:hypothetical protein
MGRVGPASKRALVLGALALGSVGLLGLGAGCGPSQEREVLPREAYRTVFLSQVFFRIGDEGPRLPRRRAEAAMDLIRRGTPLPEVAASQSEDPVSRFSDGFLGVWSPGADSSGALDGAVQVLEVGRASGPIQTQRGWSILYRHPYEEGRALERKHLRAVWGLSISWRELPNAADRSREEAEALAKQVHKELQAGTLTLQDARARYDSLGNTRTDGWLGVINRTPLNTPLFDAIDKVPENTFAAPIESQQGFVIAKRGPFLRAIVRHVLVQHVGALDTDLAMKRLPAEAEARAKEALAIVQKDMGEWDKVAERYSDEILTASDAGSLGCVGPQELPPEMEAAVLATKPGALHPNVVRTARGFHVIWRVD